MLVQNGVVCPVVHYSRRFGAAVFRKPRGTEPRLWLPVSRRRGRVQGAASLDDFTRRARWEQLVCGLECWWPWIDRILMRAARARTGIPGVARQLGEELAALPQAEGLPDFVRLSAPGRGIEEPLMALAGKASALAAFLRSREFHPRPRMRTLTDALNGQWSRRGTQFDRAMACAQQRAAMRLPPRQIASALAGTPEMGFRRSIGRCEKRLTFPPSPVAAAAHLFFRRKYKVPWPKRAARLRTRRR